MSDLDDPPSLDPSAVAKAAKLRYVSDRQPGYRRERTKGGFDFIDHTGAHITDEDEVARIRKLAIPPAYEDVWICRFANGHLQAVGRDARGRKQYRYHPRWRAVRDEAKFGRMLVFGGALPTIRARVEQDLSRRGLPREKILAALVHLLERTLARIGNDEYARTNKSFGLTTLRNRHVRLDGSRVVFDFRGKHGIEHHIDLADRRLARIVKRCRDLPGQDLFEYLDENGAPRGVGSDDVNAYLREISGENITAKDFRTWAATNLAAFALTALETFDTQTKAKKNIVLAVETVAKRLGNTPAICRKCYIHPAVFDGYLDGSLALGLKERAEATLEQPRNGLTADEVAVAAFLARQLEQTVHG